MLGIVFDAEYGEEMTNTNQNPDSGEFFFSVRNRKTLNKFPRSSDVEGNTN